MTAVVRDAGEVIQLPFTRLVELARDDEDFSNLLLRTFLARRLRMIEIGAGVKLVGSRFSIHTQELREFLLEAKALFVFIGASPRTDWLRGHVAMDAERFVLTGLDVQDGDLAAHGGQRPFFLETSQPGILAVGDVRSGSVKRVASAVGEGSMAVRMVHRRLAAS